MSKSHLFSTTFGLRRLQIKDGALHLNVERVRRLGVGRMGGSNPEFGMAEPESWIVHDPNDLKDNTQSRCPTSLQVARLTQNLFSSSQKSSFASNSMSYAPLAFPLSRSSGSPKAQSF